jgi:cysteine-rich repeat protein
MSGCHVSVIAGGSLAARAGIGGEIQLAARERLVVQGSVNATKSSNVAEAMDGTVDFTVPVGATPIINALVVPLPSVQMLPVCTGQRGLACLSPCPLCGNGTIEFPETCDDGGGAAPQSCDGCSRTCRLEDCDDGLNCTIDSCSPQLGCRHAPLELPATPCYEPSEASPTPTRTATATATGSATRTPTASAAATATQTATSTAGASATPTTPVATATPVATVTGTTLASQTPTQEPQPTATAGCIGDCTGDGRVTVDELVRGVNILLEAQPLDTCPAFDPNQSGTVTVDELVAAVRVVLGDTCS